MVSAGRLKTSGGRGGGGRAVRRPLGDTDKSDENVKKYFLILASDSGLFGFFCQHIT